MPSQNTCMRCGACCAAFRISFDCCEISDCPGGVVPLAYTCKVGASRAAMLGAEARPYRCGALSGNIGRSVTCLIYDRRPTTCREFQPEGGDNGVNPLCDQARARYGLTPLGGF